YSLGILAFACLTGSLPFTGTPADILRAHREQPLPTPQQDIPPDVAALVGRLAAKDPADRPADAAAAASLAARPRDLVAADEPGGQAVRADRAIAALVDLLAALAEPAGPGDDAGTNPLPEIAPAKRGRTLLPVAFAFAAVVAAVAALWLHGLVSWTSTHPPVSTAKVTDVYINGSALRGQPVRSRRPGRGGGRALAAQRVRAAGPRAVGPADGGGADGHPRRDNRSASSRAPRTAEHPAWPGQAESHATAESVFEPQPVDKPEPVP